MTTANAIPEQNQVEEKKRQEAYWNEQYACLKLPERSEWSCYMFGNNPKTNDGIKYTPLKGHEPNWFVRWMMKVCFDCTWVKE